MACKLQRTAGRMQESTGTANKREAEKFLALRISEVQRGVYVKPVHVPLPELWERYFAYAKTHKRSWKRDEQMYGNLSGFFWARRIWTPSPRSGWRNFSSAASRRSRRRPSTVKAPCSSTCSTWLSAGDCIRVRIPCGWVKFLPENNLQFQTLSEDGGAAFARILAALPAGADSVRGQYRPQMRRHFRSEMGGRGYRRKTTIAHHGQDTPQAGGSAQRHGVPILAGKQAVKHGPYVFYNPATGDSFYDLKAGFKAALRSAPV